MKLSPDKLTESLGLLAVATPRTVKRAAVDSFILLNWREEVMGITFVCLNEEVGR